MPYFLYYVKKKIKATPSIFVSQNYKISDSDFNELKNEINQLFKDFDLVLFKTKDNFFEIKSEKWEDSYDILSAEETEEFLSKKENWIWRPGKRGYFIAEKEGSNKIEEYLYGSENNKL